MKLLAIIFLSTIIFISNSTAQEVEPAQIPTDYIVASVNGKDVMFSEVQTMYDSNPQFKTMPMELIFDKLLEDIILTNLMVDEAKKNDIENNPDFKKEFEIVKKRLIAMYYLKKIIYDDISEIKLRNQYKRFVQDNPPQDEIKARHILVDNEKQAKSIIEKLNKGADFIEIANEISLDEGSTMDDTGGDLGWFQKEGMPTEFTDVAFSLDKGDISQEPVKTPFGWHIIKVEDKRKAKQLEFEELEELIKLQYVEQESEKILNNMKNKAKIEKYGINGKK